MAEDPTPVRDYIPEVYKQVCSAYERIDDFRAKLLGFLPLASAAGLLVLLNEAGKLEAGEANRARDAAPLIGGHGLLVLVGVFGAIFTLGLLVYEQRGIHYCIRLIRIGRDLEARMQVKEGRFREWPEYGVWRFKDRVTEPLASGLIYSSVLAAWIFVAIMSASKIAAAIAAILSGPSCLFLTWRFFRDVQWLESPGGSKSRTRFVETPRWRRGSEGRT